MVSPLLKLLLIRVQPGKRVKMEEQTFQCPVCKHHNHKLYVNTDKGVMNCFHCNFSGNIEKLRKYPSVWSKIEDHASLSVYSKLLTVREDKKLNSELLKQIKPFHELTEDDAEYDYLLSRGWDNDIMDCYEILVSNNKHFADRVFITIPDEKGDTVFYTGRTINKGVNPKYLNSVAPKDFVFNAKTPVDDFYSDNAYICEGIFDAFKLPGGIALLGKTLAKDQHNALFASLRSRKKIYICLDPGTDREAKMLARELNSWFPNKDIFILNWKDEKERDLGDLSKNMSRTDLITFVWNNSVLFSTKFFK